MRSRKTDALLLSFCVGYVFSACDSGAPKGSSRGCDIREFDDGPISAPYNFDARDVMAAAEGVWTGSSDDGSFSLSVAPNVEFGTSYGYFSEPDGTATPVSDGGECAVLRTPIVFEGGGALEGWSAVSISVRGTELAADSNSGAEMADLGGRLTIQVEPPGSNDDDDQSVPRMFILGLDGALWERESDSLAALVGQRT